MNSLGGDGIASPSLKNVFKGMHDMTSLGRGISESKDTIYDKEEDRLTEINIEVTRLLESLERKSKTDET